MAIERERIEERLALLRQQRQQLIDQVNATQGAIEDCEHWLGNWEPAPPRKRRGRRPAVATPAAAMAEASG